MSDHLRDDVRAALAMSDAELAEAQQAQQLAEASTSPTPTRRAPRFRRRTCGTRSTLPTPIRCRSRRTTAAVRADLYGEARRSAPDAPRAQRRQLLLPRAGSGGCSGCSRYLFARARQAVWRTRVPDVCAACARRAVRRAEFDELGKRRAGARCSRAAAAPAAEAARGGARRGRRRGCRSGCARDVGAQPAASSAPHIEGRSLDDFCDSRWRRWASRPTSRRCRHWRARRAARPASVPERPVGPVVGAPGRRHVVAARRPPARPRAGRCSPRASSSVPATTTCCSPPTGTAALDDDAADNPRFVAPLPAQLDAAAICPACAEQRPRAALRRRRLRAARLRAPRTRHRRRRRRRRQRRRRQWLLPAAFARGGRAYACARCVAVPARDDAADGAAAAAAAGAFALRRCPRGCGQLEFSERMCLHLAAAARRRPSRRRPCAASAVAHPPARRPPAGLPGDGVSALIEMGFDIADARDALRAPAATCRAPPSCYPPRRYRRRRRRRAAADCGAAGARRPGGDAGPRVQGHTGGGGGGDRCGAAPPRLPRAGAGRRHRGGGGAPLPAERAPEVAADERLFVRRAAAASRAAIAATSTPSSEDYAGSCDDADRAHNFIIRYQAAHRIDFNGAREGATSSGGGGVGSRVRSRTTSLKV